MSRKSKQQPQDECSNITVDIHQLTENARENQLKTDLMRSEERCLALSATIDQMLVSLNQKDEEIMALKQILMGQGPDVNQGVSPMMVSDEEYISLQQLQRLKEISKVRPLTLDETRQFDLLVKNKRLAQGNATTIEGKKIPENTGTKKLIEIASSTKRLVSKG